MYEFDQFQEVIEKYGTFLNDDGGVEIQKQAKSLPWGRGTIRNGVVQSPVKLKRHSYKNQVADFEAFVLARDTDFVLAGMVRCVGGGGNTVSGARRR